MSNLKVALTKAQWRTVKALHDGQKLFWSRPENSYFIGIPGTSTWRRTQQITVFELKAAGMIDGRLALTLDGTKLARVRSGRSGVVPRCDNCSLWTREGDSQIGRCGFGFAQPIAISDNPQVTDAHYCCNNWASKKDQEAELREL